MNPLWMNVSIKSGGTELVKGFTLSGLPIMVNGKMYLNW
jgi:hypothetical protein